MRLSILYIGKPRDPHANAIARDFLGRASHYARCDMREIRPDRYDPFAKHSGAVKVLLDPAGRPAGSHCFTGLIRQWEMEDREVVFLVGGHDGFPGEWKSKAGLMLSLSPMTFPHELARALLCEQIYRAFTTLRGHPYPR